MPLAPADEHAASRTRCVLLLASWYRVHIPFGGALLRPALLETLDAEVIALFTYRDGDVVHNAASNASMASSMSIAGVRKHLTDLGLLAALQPRLAMLHIERQLTTHELADVLRAQPSWPAMWERLNRSGCYEQTQHGKHAKNRASAPSELGRYRSM